MPSVYAYTKNYYKNNKYILQTLVTPRNGPFVTPFPTFFVRLVKANPLCTRFRTS